LKKNILVLAVIVFLLLQVFSVCFIVSASAESVWIAEKYAGNPIYTDNTLDGACWPVVVKDGSTYWLFYSIRGVGGRQEIRQARGTNGIDFTYYGYNITVSPGTWRDDGIEAHTIFKYNSTHWILYGCAQNPADAFAVGVWFSTNLINWTEHRSNPILTPTNAESVADPNVIRLSNGTYLMYYASEFADVWHTSLATSSDGLVWTKYYNSDNPIISAQAGTWYAQQCAPSDARLNGSTLQLLIAGGEGGAGKVGILESTNYINFYSPASIANPILVPGASGSWDEASIGHADFEEVGSQIFIYYRGRNSANLHRIGRAEFKRIDQQPGFLKLKWAVSLPKGKNPSQITPAIGDINGDGIMEIVESLDDLLVVLRGTDGSILWTYSRSGICEAVELCDLTKDGIPEVLVPISGVVNPSGSVRQSGLVALFGNGRVYWSRDDLGGNDCPSFPIVTHDIDGDGYPTIFFASTTWTYDYSARLTSITHDGRKLNSVWVNHPCTGGLALADYDFDGKFEVYMGDRSYAYDPPRGRGMRSWWASDLTPRWDQPEVLASAALPIIADVNGDGLLDVLSGDVDAATMMGMVDVLSAADGSFIAKHPVGSVVLTPTVYDIDGDGHLEVISATPFEIPPEYSQLFRKELVIWDLVDSKIDATVSIPYPCVWPPKVGDVTGDGNMEIILAPGDYNSTADYDILIYDKTLSLLQRIPVTGAGQLGPAVVQDIDGDGLNEVVVGGFNGKILAYDTPAPAPTPRARTEVQFYSQYRLGAAEYVPPPGVRPGPPPADNTPPYTTDHNPAPGSTGVHINTNIALTIRDAGVGVDKSTIVMKMNGLQVTPTISGTPSAYTVTYDPPTNFGYEQTVLVMVDASDLNGNKMATDSYSFTTEKNNPPSIQNESPRDGAVNVGLNPILQADVSDSNGDPVNWKIETNVTGTWTNLNSGTLPSGSGTISASTSNMNNYNTKYWWRVNASDPSGSGKWTYKIYSFTTSGPAPTYEDFTTYTEVDPNNHIARSAYHIDFDARLFESAYIYKDKGVGYFSNFEHSVDAKAVTLGSNAAEGSIWGMANDVGDFQTLAENGKTLISVRFQRAGSGDAIYIVMIEYYGGNYYFTYYKCSAGTMYYFTIKKTGTSLTCKIYSDSARTNLLATLSLTLHADHSFRYIYACSTWYYPTLSQDRIIDIDIENLKL